MKKSTLISIFCVEVARLYILLASNSNIKYTDLPLSWFFAIPLLAIPIVLIFSAFLNDDYSLFCLKSYAISRVFYILGAIAFIIVNYFIKTKNISTRINYLPAIILSIFLVFDVIIFLYIYLRDKKCR
jgi:hypothetical protein